jgi:hypothetical protein
VVIVLELAAHMVSMEVHGHCLRSIFITHTVIPAGGELSLIFTHHMAEQFLHNALAEIIVRFRPFLWLRDLDSR